MTNLAELMLRYKADDEKLRQNDLRWLMADPRGRRIFTRLLDDCGVYRASEPGEDIARLEGARAVALSIRGEIANISIEHLRDAVDEAMDTILRRRMTLTLAAQKDAQENEKETV